MPIIEVADRRSHKSVPKPSGRALPVSGAAGEPTGSHQGSRQ
jgi:hypothetical protein